jgi:DNA-binding transcriptional ArsR family regulator
MDSASKELANQQAAICSVFSNPTRVLILWTLAENEKSVGEIASTVEASLPNTSQHLRQMKESGILTSRRAAQTIFYRIAKGEIADTCHLLVRARSKRHSDHKWR